jgi:sorbitol-specific phosphotransferase system component IIC
MRPVGKIRNPIVVILLTIVTLGIYGIYWHYEMFKETNEFDNEGVSGIVGLLITIVCGIVAIFLIPWQVGETRKRAGMPERVNAIHGLWILLPILGVFIWIVQVQNAANELWEAQGAVSA